MTYAIAHRGLSAHKLENTLEAFDAASKYVGVLELDVRCTSDGVPVCAHDNNLIRAYKISANLGQLTHAELQELVPTIPTLAETLDLIAAKNLGAILDVKVTRPNAIEAIEKVVKRSKCYWNDGRQVRSGEPLDAKSLVFQSADPGLLHNVRGRTGAGVIELIRSSSSARQLLLTAAFITTYAQGVTIPEDIASRTMISTLRGLRLGTYVYTVNDEDRFNALRKANASAIFSDCVDELN